MSLQKITFHTAVLKIFLLLETTLMLQAKLRRNVPTYSTYLKKTVVKIVYYFVVSSLVITAEQKNLREEENL